MTRASTTDFEFVALRAKLAGTHGREFWRSLDEVASTNEFLQYMTREFPSQLSVWDDPAGRRNFLRIMAASLAFAGVAGCSREPPEKIVPYVRAPEYIIPGKPLFFATTMPTSGDAMGLLVESHMGRPIKIEGNPSHPASLGATDAEAQASILTLYDPDRSQTIKYRGIIDTWNRFLKVISADMEKRRARNGAGLRILTEVVTSPTLGAQLARFLEERPEARWHQYQLLHRDNVRAGARLAFDRDVDTVFHFDQPEVIVALDADFLLNMPGHVRYARDFISRRRAAPQATRMSRLYVVESTPTITGAMADHRLPLQPQMVSAVARHIAIELGVAGLEREQPQEVPGVSTGWFTALMGDLRDHRGAALVVAGDGQPAEVHALVHAINTNLQGVGRCVSYIEPVAIRPEPLTDSMRQLVDDLNHGEVETLLILGGNPVYNGAGEASFAEALANAKLRVHWSEYFDETSQLCDWHVPAAHYLESWSDARSFDGTESIVQPLIAPLYGGKTAHEIVAAFSGQAGASAYELVRQHWQHEFDGENFANRWKRALHDGAISAVPSTNKPPGTTSSADSTFPLAPHRLTVELQLRPELSRYQPTIPRNITLEWRADSIMRDGRMANNAWLQECPKPLTTITWDNAALISPATADRLQLRTGDRLKITRGGHSIVAPA